MDNVADKLEKIFPLVIGLVVTKNAEKINMCPVNWQVVSTKYELPITVCIGLSHTSYSLDIIKATKEFTFAFPAKSQLEDAIYCGTVSGRTVDKIKHTTFKFEGSKKIQPPHVKDAVMNLECKVRQIIRLETFCIVIGNVVEVKTLETKGSLDKIYALGKMTYGSIDKITIEKVGR